MIDYDEATAIRRATRLVIDSEGPNFSLLNAMMWIGLVILVIAAIASVFGLL